MEGFEKYLNIADEVDIMVFKNNNESLTLTSFVYEVTNSTQLILSNPIKDGVLYPLEKRYTYYFRFFIENNGMYLFKGIMNERITYDNLPSVRIELESDIKRIQRRKFFRVGLISVGHFLFEKRLSDAEIEQIRERMLRKYKNENEFIIDETITEKVGFDTLDLSGGGLKVISHLEFQCGDFVEGEFKISGSWVQFKGEVTRIEKKDTKRFEVGIKFLELDSITQSKIVAYVFEVERNLIKKGLM
ncbi:flagellar brake protein [Fusibacter bizertensis]